MGKIYKAYDIRGIYPDQLDEEIIFKIGRAYADLLRKENDKLTILVGRDMRISSPKLTEYLIKGLIEQGVDVIDIGLSSTPTLYFGVSYLSTAGGMQVSASHNPKEYNGVKIVRKKAFPVGYDSGIDLIEQMVSKNEFVTSTTKGTVSNQEKILEKETEFCLNYTNPGKLKSFKVVADAANAMGGLYLSELFDRLPCELIKMNFDLDGTFPAHEADPFKEENVADLKKEVIKESADLGIATDGDGDRIFFIDNEGQSVEPAILRAILSKIVLEEKPGATICYDIRPGKITRDIIEQYGGKPIVTKVGHSLIKEQAIRENAAFAGESSGHFFYNTEMGMFEMPMVVILKLLEEISKSGRSLSEIVHPLRKYSHSGEINSTVQDKNAKMKEIAEYFKDGRISWIDGVTVEYEDFWFNVRPSNTEPLLRLNLEAISDEVMSKRLEEVLKLIRI
ncbi:MAG: phosphomannomutase/phosphoglucomutase [Candidatus Kariarchaeaceae archaeon]|jgi:phosphomannomutase